MSGTRLRQVMLGDRRWRLAGWPEDSFFRHARQHLRGMMELAAVAAAVLPPQEAPHGASNGVAVDVGANLGLSVLAMAPFASRILAVEPAPHTAEALRRTIAANGLEERVAVEAVALGATTGELAFHESGHSAGSHLLSAEALGSKDLDSVSVPVRRLDELVVQHELHRLDFIKIDVEGHETEVLDGAAETLARFRPTVFLEFNAWVLQCNRNANPRAVLEDWLARFPVAHATRGNAPPLRITSDSLLAFLHDHLVKRGCADDLVLSFDDAWMARWRPPG
jgi:FkbM family methyltransferase